MFYLEHARISSQSGISAHSPTRITNTQDLFAAGASRVQKLVAVGLGPFPEKCSREPTSPRLFML